MFIISTFNSTMTATMSSASSSSLYDFSFGTDSQPRLFKHIEGQKWKKLRKLLKRRNANEFVQEKDDSGLSLVGMALGFEAPLDIIKSILTLDPNQSDATDFFGANPLHVACLNGASLEAVQYLLGNYRHLASRRDKDFRVPLHHAVECLCRDEIDFTEGTKVVDALIEVHPDSIYASDKHDDSPIDLVQVARMEVRNESKDAKRLMRLYVYLRRISVKVYRDRKERWEMEGPAITVNAEKADAKSVSTKKTQETSLTSSHITSYSNKDTVGEMEVSYSDPKTAGLQAPDGLRSVDKSDHSVSGKKQKGNRLRFWKK